MSWITFLTFSAGVVLVGIATERRVVMRVYLGGVGGRLLRGPWLRWF